MSGVDSSYISYNKKCFILIKKELRCFELTIAVALTAWLWGKIISKGWLQHINTKHFEQNGLWRRLIFYVTNKTPFLTEIITTTNSIPWLEQWAKAFAVYPCNVSSPDLKTQKQDTVSFHCEWHPSICMAKKLVVTLNHALVSNKQPNSPVAHSHQYFNHENVISYV